MAFRFFSSWFCNPDDHDVLMLLNRINENPGIFGSSALNDLTHILPTLRRQIFDSDWERRCTSLSSVISCGRRIRHVDITAVFITH